MINVQVAAMVICKTMRFRILTLDQDDDDFELTLNGNVANSYADACDIRTRC